MTGADIGGARLLTEEEWRIVAPRRLRAAEAAPYLASLLLAMPVYAIEGGTAAVDRAARLYLDMAWFGGLTHTEAVALLLHEVRHIVHGHSERAEHRGVLDEERAAWGIAADLTINDDLVAGGFDVPAEGVFCEKLGVEPGKTVEVYFDELRHREHDSPDTCGSGAGAAPHPWEFPDAGDDPDRGGDADGLGRGLSELDIDLQRRHVAGEVAKHVLQHGLGSVPSELARWAEDFLQPPTIPWRELLRTAVRRPLQVAAGVDDYTWTRPNRRRRSTGVILPATISIVPSVAVVVDTSGSIGERALNAFIAEIVGMVGQFRIQARDVPVIACDAQAHEPIPADRVIDGAKLAGGGGTDMGAGLQAAAALRPRSDLVVVFTDGHTPWPEQPPGPSVVVAVSRFGNLHGVPEWATAVGIDEELGS